MTPSELQVAAQDFWAAMRGPYHDKLCKVGPLAGESAQSAGELVQALKGNVAGTEGRVQKALRTWNFRVDFVEPTMIKVNEAYKSGDLGAGGSPITQDLYRRCAEALLYPLRSARRTELMTAIEAARSGGKPPAGMSEEEFIDLLTEARALGMLGDTEVPRLGEPTLEAEDMLGLVDEDGDDDED